MDLLFALFEFALCVELEGLLSKVLGRRGVHIYN
jgi:hypothetical protein